MLKFIKRVILFLVLAGLFFKLSVIAAIAFFPRVSPANLDINSKKIVELVNNYRLNAGLSALKTNPRLTQAAANKGKDILNRQYFNHTSPEGKKFSDWIKEVDYEYLYVGENLAIDFQTNEEAFTAWLNSPKHLENIIKSQYQETGVAVVEGKFKNRPTTVIVQLFGTRVLGVSDLADQIESYESIPGLAENYFSKETLMQKILNPPTLSALDSFSTQFLIIALTLFVFIYRPDKKINQISAKQPIISR